MKHLTSQVKEGRIHLAAFPGAKANRLYHFDIRALEEFDYGCAMIHVGINDMVRSKDRSERSSEKNNENKKNLSTL